MFAQKIDLSTHSKTLIMNMTRSQWCMCSGVFTFRFPLQWQHTVHRYLRVLHSRMIKRPPKKVTMEEARKAHHMRWPFVSQGTSDVYGMITSIFRTEDGPAFESWMKLVIIVERRFSSPSRAWSSSVGSIGRVSGDHGSAPRPTISHVYRAGIRACACPCVRTLLPLSAALSAAVLCLSAQPVDVE